MVVDSRYTEGVWYDEMNGDFCRIEQQTEGATLVTPDGDDEYYEWDDTEVASRELERDFRPVPDLAVENPAEFIIQILDLVQRETRLSSDDMIGLSYAREQVTIRER